MPRHSIHGLGYTLLPHGEHNRGPLTRLFRCVVLPKPLHDDLGVQGRRQAH